MFKYISLAVLLSVVYAAPEELSRNPLCSERNGYFAIGGNCDAYIECKDYESSELICPDGLHYNPEAVWPSYPCSYPMDAPCLDRGNPQPAKPTPECPHQYGFFPSPTNDAIHCGSYLMCVAGHAIEMECPPGLGFNSNTSRCDWPDLISSCNTEQFLGFQCPSAPFDEQGNQLEVVNYPYEYSCYAFFTCKQGQPRFLTCDLGLAFDATRGVCVDASKVQCADPK